ncbi:uncharacterized protein O3C94_014246 [Discoglossus pictus]
MQDQSAGMSVRWMSLLLTLIIFLPCVLTMDIQCPSLCNCTSSNNIYVICTSAQLSTFPDSFPPSTVSISIEFTNITSIPPESLSAVPLLEELHLTNNVLNSLPDQLLIPLNKLNTLDLTNNHLMSVNHTLFLDMPNLKNLILRGNQLTELWSEKTSILQKLTWLDISKNRLSVVTSCSFNTFHYIQSLDLSYNQLHEVPSTLLLSMPFLRHLNLEGNKLTTLPSDLFRRNIILQYIFLAKNALRFLPAALLQPLSNPHIFYLSKRMPSIPPPGLLKSGQELVADKEQILDLSNNPWYCDCHMLPLHSWVTQHKGVMYRMDSTQCAGPEALRNLTLIEVKEQDLPRNCPEKKIPSK